MTAVSTQRVHYHNNWFEVGLLLRVAQTSGVLRHPPTVVVKAFIAAAKRHNGCCNDDIFYPRVPWPPVLPPQSFLLDRMSPYLSDYFTSTTTALCTVDNRDTNCRPTPVGYQQTAYLS